MIMVCCSLKNRRYVILRLLFVRKFDADHENVPNHYPEQKIGISLPQQKDLFPFSNQGSKFGIFL